VAYRLSSGASLDSARLWRQEGCVAGAFVADELRAALEVAGFADVSIQPTQVFRRPDLLALAEQLDPALIPANLDREATVSALDGVVTSSFIRAVKPA
jgi:hypothetical protein